MSLFKIGDKMIILKDEDGINTSKIEKACLIFNKYEKIIHYFSV